MRICQIVCASLVVLLSSVSALGQQSAYQNSPLGRWVTMDDATGKPASIVILQEEGGRITGKIEKVYDPFPKEANPRCTNCKGDLKDKPMVGMKILWDLARRGDGWSGGMIFDPNSGKTYHCALALESGGSRMKIRGFMGVSVFGRTELWERAR